MALGVGPSFMGGMSNAIGRQSNWMRNKRPPMNTGAGAGARFGAGSPVFGGATTPGNEGMNDTRAIGGFGSYPKDFTPFGAGGGTKTPIFQSLPEAGGAMDTMNRPAVMPGSFSWAPGGMAGAAGRLRGAAMNPAARQAVGAGAGAMKGMMGRGGGINTAPSQDSFMNKPLSRNDSGWGPLLGGHAMMGGTAVPYQNLGGAYGALMNRGYDIMNPGTFGDMSATARNMGWM